MSTTIEATVTTLRDLAVHYEQATTMGVPVQLPANLVNACALIARLDGASTHRAPTGARTVRAASLAAVRPGEVVTVGEVVLRVRAAGMAANPDTVSNELSRWVREGALRRQARGTYHRVGSSTPAVEQQ